MPLPGPQSDFLVTSQPGIKRDGTQFEGENYVDGRWVRWQRGYPRKILGYRQITTHFAGPARALDVHPRNGMLLVHQASATSIQRVQLSSDGFGDGIINRTPSALTNVQTRSWSLSSMWDASGSGTPRLFAYAGDNLVAIDSENNGVTYWGDIHGTAILTTATGIPAVSGGVCPVPPFLFAFGSNGRVAWSDANLPNTFTGGSSGSANISPTKAVAMRALRSPGGNAPAALIWCLDSLYRATFTGGAAVFRFDSLSGESSILSPTAIVEYDGVFYWPGTDRWLMFNGVVREVQNNLNRDYFFDNVNYSQRSKIWGVKVPRFGEIWWFYPRGTATECTHAIIYNVRENTWYDTDIARSAGYYSQVFPYPVMCSATSIVSGTTATGFALWQHELGVDQIEGTKALAIQSFYETADLSYVARGAERDGWLGIDRWVECFTFEPDFIQQGTMNLYVKGRAYARSPETGTPNVDGIQTSTAYSFTATTVKVNMKQQRREMRLRVESNEAGGYYESGDCLIRLKIGDGRQ